jgi:hypothetical protein
MVVIQNREEETFSLIFIVYESLKYSNLGLVRLAPSNQTSPTRVEI